jgi:ribulose 1,5-bisphosphate synthetase/thiazole synthase
VEWIHFDQDRKTLTGGGVGGGGALVNTAIQVTAKKLFASFIGLPYWNMTETILVLKIVF